MNTERFIAKRIIHAGARSFSGPIIRIAVITVALGISVMIVALAIVTGFQKQVREKIIGFGSHIQIVKFDANNSLEYQPISINQSFYPSLEKEKGIKHIQVFATKGAIVKTTGQIQGIIAKGIGKDFDWSFFRDKLLEGKMFSAADTIASDSVLVSKALCNLLNLKLGDPLRTYFIIDNQARGRRFIISGIYSTGLTEFDLKYVFCDIRHIQKLNNWPPDKVSGFDVFINDFKDLNAMTELVFKKTGIDLNTRSIRETHPQLFDWLDLQDTNVLIIIVLMVLVAGMAMISTLLVLILERTNMIGLLKAIGARNASIRRIFIYNAAYIIGKGLLWGNIIGLSICLIQKYLQLIKLPQESYFVSVVPINTSWMHLLLLNAGTMVICTLILIVPSFIISRISPVKAIRFD